MPKELLEVKTLDDYLKEVNYTALNSYRPSDFSLHFINFMKLITPNNAGLENTSPLFHYDMLDQIAKYKKNLLVAFRGSAKSTLLAQTMIFYIAVFNKLPTISGKVQVGMYVSDTIDNGVVTMKNNLKYQYDHSDTLQQLLPKATFTEQSWVFENKDKVPSAFRGFGAASGIRGFRMFGLRPSLAILDDLLSDKGAESTTQVEDLNKIIDSAITHALHPEKKAIIYVGTPFNKKDPIYTNVESGTWNVRTYPVCQQIPCERHEFVGAWADRFSYDTVMSMYTDAVKKGRVDDFNKEIMLKVTSDENRLIQDEDILWYNHSSVTDSMQDYNFYITTDTATTETQANDLSTLNVWAYSKDRCWYWVDGVLKRMTMDIWVEWLFTFIEKYTPISFGLEIAGPQRGYLDFIKQQMVQRRIFCPIATGPTGSEGFSPTKSKLERFNLAVPLFKTRMIKFPYELRGSQLLARGIDQVKSVTYSGIKSKHDEFIDNISQLPLLRAITKGEEVLDTTTQRNYDPIYGLHEDDSEDNNNTNFSPYI